MTVFPKTTVEHTMEAPDAEIVRRVRGGDIGAYRGLVDRHYGRCLRFATHMLGNRADAEEASQDAFAKAYRYLASYEEREQFGPWLMQILVNECRTAAARLSRNGAFLTLDNGIDVPDIDRRSESDTATDIQFALARLDPAHREVIVLKYFDDLTYEDMSAITGLQVSALKMRVKRAREHLEALLVERTP